jgi:hypothetical protein
MSGLAWRTWAREGGSGEWVQDVATGRIIGHVRRHTVTPGERAGWGARRPRGGEWVGVPMFSGPALFEPTRAAAAEALHTLWTNL